VAPLLNTDPSTILPHRPPFLFLDKIVACEPGVSADAEMVVTVESVPFPPVLLIESIAQLAGIAAGQSADAKGMLAAVSGGKLPLSVEAGKYRVRAKIIKSFGTLHMVEGEVLAEEALVASAMITLAVIEGRQ